ncbi:hypothetical protein AB0H87_04515, partial [Asanoa sp. NPDC050611]
MTDPSALTNLISDATAALSAAVPRDAVVGEGVAADGLIAVRVALPGRVVGMDLDPAALRLPLPELVASLTDLRAEVAEAGEVTLGGPAL